MMTKALLAFGATLLLATTASAADGSIVLTAGTVTPVLQQATTVHRAYERLINVGTSGVAWCSRYDQNPAPNKAGSFPLAPFGNALGQPSSEEFNAPQILPQQALWCTADTGTVALTAEVLP